MVRLWRGWRNQILPDAGGYLDQPAKMIEAFEFMESEFQEAKK